MAFWGTIGQKLGRGLKQIWRFRKQGARKGIWSKAKGSNEGKRCSHQSFVSRAVVEAAWGSGDAHFQSIATCGPRPQAVGARGAPHLPFGFASKPSPSAPWSQGLLSVFWERGAQTCLPAAHGVALRAGPYDPSSPASAQDPREGPSLTRRMTRDVLGSRPKEAAPEEVLVSFPSRGS